MGKLVEKRLGTIPSAEDRAQMQMEGGSALLRISDFTRGSDNKMAVTAGTGITTGTDTIFRSSVQRVGDIVTTTIYIDMDGLESGDVTDIIGVAAAANCHLGQITTARNGIIFDGTMKCLETPAGGEPDIDLYSADEATGTQDAVVTGLTNDTALLAPGVDWTSALVTKPLALFPAADQYLYLSTSGGATAVEYTAGKFLITLYGY